MMTNNKRTAVYVNHSADEPVAPILRSCLAEVASRKWDSDEDADVFEDVDGTREGLDSLRKLLDGYTAVVTYDLKHFSRGPRDFLDFVSHADGEGVRVVTVKDSLDTGVKAGQQFLRHLESLTDAQREHTSRAVTKRQQERVANGDWRGGSPPFGWSSPDGPSKHVLVLDEEESVLLREAVDRVIAGDTVSAVINDWNKRGIRTRRDGQWRDTTLRRALRRPYLVGHLPDGSDVQRDDKGRPLKAVEPLLTSREAKKLATALGEKRQMAAPSAEGTLLAGLAFCAHCGSKMYGRNADDSSAVYFCSKRNANNDGNRCPGVAVSMLHLEEFVAEAVKAYLSPELLSRLPRTAETLDREIRAVRDAMNELQKDRYERGVYEGKDGMEAFRNEWSRLSVTLGELKSRRYLLTELDVSPPSGLSGNLKETWSKLSIAEQSEIVETVIERVEVSKGRRGQPFDADRVNVVWKSR